MRAFILYANGRKLATAGIGSNGVLAVAVTWVGHVKRAAGTKRAIARDEVGVRLGGLDSDSDEHLDWCNQRLRVGDEVRIKVIETTSVDRPKRRHQRNPAQELAAQKRYVRRMAKEFGWTIRRRR
jgi:hypothetical protein